MNEAKLRTKTYETAVNEKKELKIKLEVEKIDLNLRNIYPIRLIIYKIFRIGLRYGKMNNQNLYQHYGNLLRTI
jgi:hypothetical protein